MKIKYIAISAVVLGIMTVGGVAKADSGSKVVVANRANWGWDNDWRWRNNRFYHKKFFFRHNYFRPFHYYNYWYPHWNYGNWGW